jgi:hypothetical protein
MSRRGGRVLPRARIHWFGIDEGGRRTPPNGPRFAATAAFEEDWTRGKEAARVYSVALLFESSSSSRDHEAFLDFMSPGLVRAALRPGARMVIFDGPHPIASAELLAGHRG